MNHSQLAKEILRLVGDEKNISHVTHCYTRLRFTLKDNKKAKKEEIENLNGVISVQVQSGQFQVVIGNEVSRVYKELEKIAEIDTESDEEVKSTEKGNLLGRFFEMLAGIFTPVIPVIAGAGLIKGILGLITLFEWVPPGSDILTILTVVSDGVFYFLPFFLAVTAARRFKVNEIMAIALAGGFMYPTIIDGARAIADGGPEGLLLLGLPLPFISYSSTVIPIIIAVWVLSYVHRFVDMYMPSAVRIIFTPTIVLLIMIPLQLIAIGPLGSYLGVGLAGGITWLFDEAGILAGGILGAVRPLIVIVGMHYGLMPIAMQNIAVYGVDYLLPVFFMANMGQAAAALAVLLKTKNKEMKTLAGSSSLSAFLGITEPAMYGVNLRLRRPFIAALIGAGIGSAFITAFNVTANAFVLPGLTSLPVYGGPNFIYLLIGFAIVVGVTMAIVFVWGFEDIPTKADKVEKPENEEDASTPEAHVLGAHATVFNPIQGTLVPLEEVEDPTFANGTFGKGVAIEPKDGIVFAPFDGTVAAFFKTSHAIGLRSDTGIELLIHVGIDTVNLDGKYFEAIVKQGDEIKQGQPLLRFDVTKIQEAGYKTITPVIVTNSADYLDVLTNDDQEAIAEGDWIIKAVS